LHEIFVLMEIENKSTIVDWLIFLVSTVAFVVMLFVLPEWSWLTFPFIGTFLAKALNVL
jgi:hypothetical protein